MLYLGILHIIILGRVRFLEFVVLGNVKTGSKTVRWATERQHRRQLDCSYSYSITKNIKVSLELSGY